MNQPDISSSNLASVPVFLRETNDGVLLSVKLQPRASKNEIAEPLGDELKIKVTAPPVDSAANEALLELLAEKLNCARNQIEIIRGHKSRHKTILLRGFKAEEIISKLTGNHETHKKHKLVVGRASPRAA